MKKVRKEKKVVKKKEQQRFGDMKLMAKIQPQGGINFNKDEALIRTGTGYEACLEIYKYPNEVRRHWLTNLCSINNTVAMIDMTSEDTVEVKKNINKSMIEQESRYRSASGHLERSESQNKYNELGILMEEVGNMGEIVKDVKAKIFVADHEREGLENRIAKIIGKLDPDGYRATISLNENESQWMSMYQTYTEQLKNPYAIEGQPLVSEAVAGGYPFHFSKLEDTMGTYLGTTKCGGNVLFDLFTKTSTRLSYNAVVMGKMGSGKSTLLKKIFEDRAARGDYVRAFDISGEFRNLTKKCGGKIIKMDGTNGILNPLEILKFSDNDYANFARHISKVSTIYRFLRHLSPGQGEEEVTQFQDVLSEVYKQYNLINEPGKEVQKITGLPADSYPRFRDVLEYVNQKTKNIQNGKYNELELEIAKKELLLLDKIKKILEKIVSTYGYIFDGYTSMDNISDEQIVTFDISELKEMSSEIFDAAIFNMLSLCWDNCVTNGTIMKDLWQRGKIEPEDVIHFVTIVDESHRWINTQKLQAVKMIIDYEREARKYFGSIILASQSIRDYVPDGSSSEAFNQIKNIFELTQYKFIFQHDNNLQDLFRKVFQDSLTQSQLARIPLLEIGQTILCISSESNIEFNVHLTKEEERLFDGGV